MTTVSLLKVPQTNATFKKIGSIHSGRFVLHGPYYVLLCNITRVLDTILLLICTCTTLYGKIIFLQKKPHTSLQSKSLI